MDNFEQECWAFCFFAIERSNALRRTIFFFLFFVALPGSHLRLLKARAAGGKKRRKIAGGRGTLRWSSWTVPFSQ